MSESSSLQERYLKLIDHIVEITLQGKIRSKTQVYNFLVQGIEKGTGEIFERCLAERIAKAESQLETKLKAARILRALETIEGEWERWQEENLTSAAIALATEDILTAESYDRLPILLDIIDPNQEEPLTLKELHQLATALQQTATARNESDLAQLAKGIFQGLASWQLLEGDLVSWIYEQGKGSIGFGEILEQPSPWGLWAKKVNHSSLQKLFQTLATNQSLIEFALQQKDIELSAWVELAVVMQCLQGGLLNFFDQRVYSSQLGAKLSISTFLTFALIWSQLANGWNQVETEHYYGDTCFQITLQILRIFAQRDYFPLYGGIFASFSGEYLQETLDYLNEPLHQVEGTAEIARIFTLLGYSAQAQSRYEEAIIFHEEALVIAREDGDTACEIANLNHLSRIEVAQKNYAEAIAYSQRALILSRQAGDTRGQANALANLGYSEILQAQELATMDTEVYEMAINYLQQGLTASEKLGDRQSESLCCSSLGIAYVVLEQPEAAIEYLVKGLAAAQFSGDLYLQGLNFVYLAEAYYRVSLIEKAILSGYLGMYLLEQIGAKQWRQPGGLLTILQGQQGQNFSRILEQARPEIISLIGVDGYDYLPELLKKYQETI
jgi:tetratricopeptide (TPR) repeat protein